jgi:membrane protease YdiL (CAAX protease family)
MRLNILLIALPALIAAPVSYHVLPTWFGEGSRYWIVDFFVGVAIPLLCLYTLYKKGVGPNDYGLPRSLGGYKIAEFVSISFLCTLAFLASIIVDTIARIYCVIDPVGDPGLRLGRDGFGMLTVVYYATTAAFFDEIFFRGVLGAVFLKNRTQVNTIVYACVSASLFTIAHSGSDLASTISYLYFGIVSAMVYVLLRNLWPLIIAHFITDVVLLTWWLHVFNTGLNGLNGPGSN